MKPSIYDYSHLSAGVEAAVAQSSPVPMQVTVLKLPENEMMVEHYIREIVISNISKDLAGAKAFYVIERLRELFFKNNGQLDALSRMNIFCLFNKDLTLDGLKVLNQDLSDDALYKIREERDKKTFNHFDKNVSIHNLTVLQKTREMLFANMKMISKLKPADHAKYSAYTKTAREIERLFVQQHRNFSVVMPIEVTDLS